MANVGIIGAGSWGCALATVLESNGHCVKAVSYTHLLMMHQP